MRIHSSTGQFYPEKSSSFISSRFLYILSHNLLPLVTYQFRKAFLLLFFFLIFILLSETFLLNVFKETAEHCIFNQVWLPIISFKQCLSLVISFIWTSLQCFAVDFHCIRSPDIFFLYSYYLSADLNAFTFNSQSKSFQPYAVTPSFQIVAPSLLVKKNYYTTTKSLISFQSETTNITFNSSYLFNMSPGKMHRHPRYLGNLPVILLSLF